MVKRPNTPPPADEEPRILCVTLPYPQVNPIDFEADGGMEVLLYNWLAQFIKKEALYYIYWMPRSDKILVSVERKEDGYYNSILGEHRWSDFLADPPKGVEKRMSTIFYSTFSYDRDVQRHGWRQKWVLPEWFEDDYNSHFVQPYPKPTYTSRVPDLCRPIPAPKVASTGPIVGTSAWAYPYDADASSGATIPTNPNGEGKKKGKKSAGKLGSLPFV